MFETQRWLIAGYIIGRIRIRGGPWVAKMLLCSSIVLWVVVVDMGSTSNHLHGVCIYHDEEYLVREYMDMAKSTCRRSQRAEGNLTWCRCTWGGECLVHWQLSQLETTLSRSLSIPGHQTNDWAKAFIRVPPWCPLCRTLITASRPFCGTTRRLPLRRQRCSTKSSS